MRMWKDFHGPNAAYVLDLYDRFLTNPESVDPQTRAVFQRWKPGEETTVQTGTPAAAVEKMVGTVNLAQAVREHGHFAAQLDPLGDAPKGDPALDLATYGLSEDDLQGLPATLVGGPIAEGAGNAYEAVLKLRAVYSASTGYDFDHVRIPEERAWLRHAVESGTFGASRDPINEKALLERLTQVESFERFLHRIFPGKTRFSLEGLDIMVPVLDEVIGDAAEDGTRNVLIGMAHRGRLNVLVHVLNKPYTQILAEFKDPVNLKKHGDAPGWTGDVKYHAGALRTGRVGEMIDIVVSMAPNPSHLEAVNPVVEGMARAAGTNVDHSGQVRFDPAVTLPILIHGDAAFAGQGVVAETLNFSRIHGYRTGGTVHIIANNQLGYTTNPQASRSTLYSSDMAKGFEIPVIHVNADDPEACIAAARMAIAYRTQFKKDFLIDLIGYRRHGHNEGDEPSFTQPVLYAKIERHPTVREIWSNRLVERKVIQPLEAEDLVRARMEELHQVLERLRAEDDIVLTQPEPPPPGAARRVKTADKSENAPAAWPGAFA